jgi:hypothetical protein
MSQEASFMKKGFEVKFLLAIMTAAVLTGACAGAEVIGIRAALEPSMKKVVIDEAKAPSLFYLELRNHPEAKEDDKVHRVDFSEVDAQDVFDQFFNNVDGIVFKNMGHGRGGIKGNSAVIENFSKMLNAKTKNSFSKVEKVMLKLVKKRKISDVFWFRFDSYNERTQYLILIDNHQKVVMVDMDEDFGPEE